MTTPISLEPSAYMIRIADDGEYVLNPDKEYGMIAIAAENVILRSADPSKKVVVRCPDTGNDLSVGVLIQYGDRRFGSVELRGISIKPANDTALGGGILGIRAYGSGTSLRFVDCEVIGGTGAAVIEVAQDREAAGDWWNNVEFERCYFGNQHHRFRPVIRNGVSTLERAGHAGGVFIAGCQVVKVLSCVFDRCGWGQGGGPGRIFDQAFYGHGTCQSFVVENSIFARAAATGCQLRGGYGVARGNLFLDNPIGLNVGHKRGRDENQPHIYPRYTRFTGIVEDNVFLGAADIDENLPRGIGIDCNDLNGVAIVGNELHDGNQAVGTHEAIQTDATCENVKKSKNYVRNWGSVGNRWMSRSFSLLAYMNSIGCPREGVDDFIRRAVCFDDSRMTAKAVVAWTKARRA